MEINLAIADRARSGEALTVAEIDELAASDLLSLGMLADEVRRSRVGDEVTYVRVFELAGASDASGASSASGAEVRLKDLRATLADTEAAITDARRLAGTARLTGFSLADISHRESWGPLKDVLARLKAAGLDAIAEAPVDLLPDVEGALAACEEAGLPVQCLSLQKPIDDGTTLWLVHLRSLMQRFPSIAAVAPLPREQSIAVPTTGYADVRAVALARLALNGVRNIQVDWTQYGPKLAQVALTFGANDFDRVSTLDDDSLGRRRTTLEDVKRNITAAGFRPIER
jgi:2-iminoacetate synthase ThiH